MASNESIPSTSTQRRGRGRRVCEAMGCENKLAHLFAWPVNHPERAARWTAFVNARRKTFKPEKNSRLCHVHFTDDSFSNLSQYNAKVVKTLYLDRKTAVPTIQVTGLSAHQLSEGIDLAQQKLSPTKRSIPGLKGKGKRSFLRTALADPSSIIQPINRPVTTRRIGKQIKQTFEKPPTLKKGLCSIGVQTGARRFKRRVRSKKNQCCLYVYDDAPETSATHYAENDIESESDESDSDIDIDGDDEWLPTEDEKVEYAESAHDNESNKSQERKGRWFDEPKYIVAESKLKELMRHCASCGGVAYGQEVQRMGAYAQFTITCTEYNCRHEQTWETSHTLNQKYVINLLLFAAILFSGGLAERFLRIMSFLHIYTHSSRTFFKHQADYLHGVVRKIYDQEQQLVVQENKRDGHTINISGDGRCDSPGHSALYGIYTFMDCATSKVLCFSLVKSTEVTSSNAMEMEGLIRCRNDMNRLELPIGSLTTDRHVQIQAYMNKSWKEVEHFYDTWHISKGLKKKLASISKTKANAVICKWIKSISNHLYWTVDTTEPNTDLRKAKWESVLHHIGNVHNFNSDVYPACEHGNLESEVDCTGKVKKRIWIMEGTPAHKALTPILTDKNLLKGLQKAGKLTTSELESFHAIVNHNAPKMYGFSYSGMMSRVQLTVLYHNENCQRPVVTNADGSIQYKVIRKKVTKLMPTVSVIRIPATYNYVEKLMLQLETHMIENSKPAFKDPDVPTLSSKGPAADKGSLITEQLSRGLHTKPLYLPTE